MMETKRALLLLSFAIVLSISLGREFSDQTHGHDWNYLVLSQWWPQSQCYYKNGADSLDDRSFRLVNEYRFNNACVPTGVNSWTIHGLWPTFNGTPNPEFCNNSWKFEENKIKDLKPKMMKQWIDLPDVSQTEHFWEHEWMRHGTCATSLPTLNNEHNYFSKALTLNLKFNLLRIFASEGLSPSEEKTYEFQDFENAILKKLNVKGRVICLEDSNGDKYLGGFRICLDKTFNLMDCKVTEPEKCGEGDQLKYPVIIRPVS